MATSLPDTTAVHNVSTVGEPISLSLQITFGITYGSIAIITLAGNLLVLIAVLKFQRLQIPTNYFVCSLAFADVTVAILVLPLSLIYDLSGGAWSFGWVLCYFWRSCDVMCCTASILHLCCISLDRYWAITKPFTYSMKMSKKRVACMIISAWFCSVCISFIPIYLGWFTDNPETLYTDTGTCDLRVNKIYAVLSAMTSFYIPFIVMVFSYAAILRIAKIQANAIKKSIPRHSYTGGNGQDKYESTASDRKAVRTLGIIMGVFIVSWLPFFLMYIIMPFCSECEISPMAISVITWLGYVNSCMNPVIYAFMNRDFRVSFKKLLTCSIS
ncbi:tyramine receptor 1 [Argonauta hians]